MREGVVACPVHGDNETTPNCPNCRPYMTDTTDQNVNISIPVEGSVPVQTVEPTQSVQTPPLSPAQPVEGAVPLTTIPPVDNQTQNQDLSTTSPQETQPIETTPPVVQSESSSDAVTQQEEVKPVEENKAVGRPCEFCANYEKYTEIGKTYVSKFDVTKEQKKIEVPFVQELAAILDCDDETIELWANKINKETEVLEHKEFSATIKKLKNIQKLRLLQRTLGRFNPTGAIFQLKVNHGAIETEKKIVAGDSNEPLSITIIEEKKLPEDE